MNLSTQIQKQIKRFPEGKTFGYPDLDISREDFQSTAKILERLQGNSHSVNSSFIEVILATDFLQSQMYKNSKGTTVDTITIEKANQYIFPFPPLAEQQRIVTKIEDIFNLLDKIQESL
jgi:restriction endonuclease S subunit